MAISTNQKPTIYRNLYENTGPDKDDYCLQPFYSHFKKTSFKMWNFKNKTYIQFDKSEYFHLFEAVDRVSEAQLQVSGNVN